MKSFFRSILVSILTLEATLVLRKYKPKIVVVTGSVGKTSTKDAIFTALQLRYRVRKADKSFNSEFGVPLTILGCPNGWHDIRQWIENIFEGLGLIFLSHKSYPEWLVLEVGADKPGDVRSILRYVKPDIVVVTRLPDVPVHVEFYASPQEVIEEEGMPAHALSGDGLLVTNADDANIEKLKEQVRAKIMTVGVHHAATVVFSNELIIEEAGRPTGIAFTVTHEGAVVPFALNGVLGRQHAYAVSLAVAVGLSQGINLVDLSQAFTKHQTPPGRMRILKGNKGTTILDDTYNASPIAVEEALKTLREVSVSGRRIAVLGDMLELGSYSREMHEHIGKIAAGIVDELLTVGIRARGIAQAALAEGMSEKKILQYEESEQAGKELDQMLEEGDVVLVKGSQSIRMERVTKDVMAEPESASELLCRQEEYWQNKK